MDCLFNVYKPKGPTSHDVVALLRRASGVRRIGHAGTLDPLAEGVLVVAVGQATRVIEYLADADKAYRATVHLGVETETYDAEGKVVAERPIGHLRREDVEAALARLRGRIVQRPPAYSAVSVGGRRLYDLARRGQAVEAPAREVEITRLELERWEPPLVTLLVECSKGTYIRSLAHDLGQALDIGAHLAALVRLRVGRFTVEQAVPLAELEARLREGREGREGTWREVAIAPDAAVGHLPELRVDAAAAGRLVNGSTLDAGPVRGAEAGDGPASWVRVYGPEGRFLAIGRREARGGRVVLRPEKVFAAAASA